MNIDFKGMVPPALAKFWDKYGFVLLIVLVGAVVFLSFRPARVVTTEVKMVDRSWEKKMLVQLSTLKSEFSSQLSVLSSKYDKVVKVANDINTVTTNEKKYDPVSGKLIADITTTTRIDKSKIDSTATSGTSIQSATNAGSSSIGTTSVTVYEAGKNKITEKVVKVTENVGVLAYGAGFNSIGSCTMLGMGINLSPSTTILVGPTFSATAQLGIFLFGRGSF
jgi:hypothetical protein